MNDSDFRAFHARIAADYDILPYEAPLDPALEMHKVLGMGRLYGCGGAAHDVLDLGCGTGLELARAGSQASGRLIGIDLSSKNCRKARARLAMFGNRAEIRTADILDLDGDHMGRFDVIYAI